MINIPTWKKVLILLTCAYGILYSLPNLADVKTQEWLRANLPGWMPVNTVNLGLDLRGGAHLLYEVDTDVVFRERAEMLGQDMRKSLRKEKIAYASIAPIENGVRIVLSDPATADKVTALIAAYDQTLETIKAADGKTLEARMGEAAIGQLRSQTIAQSIEIIRRRVDEMGTTEPTIQRQGDNRILLQVPGADAESLKRIVGKTAKLGFHLLKDSGGKAVGGTRMLPMVEEPGTKIPVQRLAMVTGEMLDNAQPNFSEGEPVVSFSLNGSGASRFCDVTRNNIGKPFAIVLDNQVISAPVIRSEICGGQGQISGGFSLEEASDLAVLLRAGALPAPLNVIEERTVGPSLGADSVKSGQLAAGVSMCLVMLFMLLAYGFFGILADIALVVNVALIFALLSALQATLTLPGIAGIALTIGMAVDANVLIFERIREELRAGRSPFSAIETGYSKAMASIVDSNLTTLIAGAILFVLGTGPIKGFAVTLAIGIVTSMFSAIMLTRLMVATWLRWKRPASLQI